MSFSRLKRLLEFDVMIAAIIFIALLGFMRTDDPDFFWHLKNGELVIAAGALFDQDPFSHTALGAPLQVTGWFFDVLIAYTWEHFGPFGVRALAATFVILTWLGVYKSAALFIERKQICALVGLVAMILLFNVMALRPNLFTHCAFAWVLFFLLKYLKYQDIRNLLPLIPLFALWPNFHYGFIAALALIGLFVCSAIADRLLPLSDEKPLDCLLALKPTAVFIACALAVAINPYGLQIYFETAYMASRGDASVISEWQSPNFDLLIFKFLLVSIFLYIGQLFILKSRMSWFQFIVPGALLFGVLTAQRHLGFWAVVIPVFMAIAMVQLVTQRDQENAAASPKWLLNGTTAPATYYLNAIILLVISSLVIIGAPAAAKNNQKQFSTLIPIPAVDFLIDRVPPGNLYNSYVSGGYLIWRGYPDFPVFSDGRYFPYSDEILEASWHIASGLPHSLELLAKYNVEIVIFGTNTALAEQLYNSPKYRAVFSDEDNSIYVSANDKYADVPGVERFNLDLDLLIAPPVTQATR